MRKDVLSKYYYELSPPILRKWVDKIFRGQPLWYFQGRYASWEDAKKIASGYEDKNIFEKVLSATLKVKNGEAACERDSVIFDTIQYSWPLLANLMWVACKNNGSLNVLDFGGALGSSYFQNKKYLDGLPNVKWNIVEQSHYVDAGNKEISSYNLSFYKSIEDCISKNKINVAVFSGVLDFVENPYEILSKILSMGVKNIIIDRSVFLKNKYDAYEDAITIQIIKPDIFSATLPVRLLSFLKIKSYLKNAWGMEIIEDFESIGGEGDDWEFKGFLAAK
jgi:putative methyltransferase (TIGR04325 family)